MRTSVAVLVMALAAALAGCSEADRLVGPAGHESPAIVSDPTTVTVHGGISGAMRPADGTIHSVVYVSLPPGTFPSAENVLIRHDATGSLRTVLLVDGGFDPVAIMANAGDTLQIIATRNGVESAHVKVVVPIKRPPRVVRTVPPRGKTDVPLNALILLVFSEPIDAQTLTSASVRLGTGEAPVSGHFEFLDAAGLMVTFVPAESLSPATRYRLVVAQDVRDLDGEPLEEAVTIEFTTGEAPQVPPPSDGVAALAYVGVTYSDLNDVIGNKDIYVRQPGYALRLTSHPASDVEPAWSSDRMRIAFRSERDGNSEIYVMHADGSDTRRLTNETSGDYHPTWSPDGSRIAFVTDRDGNAEIYVMSADGSEPVRLTNHPATDDSPAWSPDGSRIAFSSERDGNSEIYVMNADGSSASRVTNNAVDDIDPAWSPDGGKLTYSQLIPTTARGSCIDVEDIDTGDGPDDYRDMCRWDVIVMNADGSDVSRLAFPLAPQWLSSGWWLSVFQAKDPTWSPDGQQIATSVFYCLSDFGGADCHSSNPILIVPVANSANIVQLNGLPGILYSPVTEVNPAWR